MSSYRFKMTDVLQALLLLAYLAALFGMPALIMWFAHHPHSIRF